MRKLLPFVAVLLAFAPGSRTAETLAAPVPKAPEPPTIDGKYTLLSVADGTGAAMGGLGGPAGLIGPGGGFAGGGFGVGGIRPAALQRAEVTVTKTEITIEPRLVAVTPVTMEYTLDATKTPITIDVETISLRGKKTKTLGIAEVVGTRLILAIAKEGGDRPKNTEEADGVTVYYLQKAPPPPRVEYRIVAMTVGKEADAEKELNKLAQDGFEVMNTTNPAAADGKAAPTTVHFLLKRTAKP
jgi:uncharacterized protein (TIGR03067 family)